MLKWLLGIPLVLVVIVAVVGVFLPTEYSLSRSVVIAAEPEALHELVGDLERWPEWTPWQDEDPTIQTTLGERTQGVGAHQSWKGTDGDGKLTFTESDPTKGIAYDMAFIEGDKEMPSSGYMRYKKVGQATEVTWGMQGKLEMPVVGGYFVLMMDRMVGPMFEKGLAKLKSSAEAKGAAK